MNGQQRASGTQGTPARLTGGAPNMLTNLVSHGGTQTSILVALVIGVAEPFAQPILRDPLGLPAWVPIAVAGVMAIALSYFQVRTLPRMATIDKLVFIPIGALVLFSLAYATKQGTTGGGTGNAAAYQEQLDNLESQLKSAEDLINTLTGRPISAVPAPAAIPMAQRPRRAPSWLERAADFLQSEAHAQTQPPASGSGTQPSEDADAAKKQEALEKYLQQRAEFEKRKEELDKEISDQKAQAPLWKPYGSENPPKKQKTE